MVNAIEQDHARFRRIVRGKVREDLKRFIARGEFIGREGQRHVSVPVNDIDIPTFRFGDNNAGVGMGEGEEGQGVGQPGQGRSGQGGEQAGKHILEVDIQLDELADILGEDLGLPRIMPKGSHELTTTRDKYTGIRPVGPAGLRHFKRTYKAALRRQMALGLYDPANPVIIPVKEDLRYRSWTEVKKPHSNAVIVYMMDVSGSMGAEQKELVRLHAFWIDTWLRRNYEGIESRYVVHDVAAQEVDRATFFAVREDGGTRISSALTCAKGLIDRHYNPDDWNIYLFHFSDGDNSSDSDNTLCCQILERDLLASVNMFGYCQVKSAYGSGQFHGVLKDRFVDRKPGPDSPLAKVVVSKVNEREDIYDSLRTFFRVAR